ncbi:MAG: two-component regulator propeller domain-containing protein [Planctomycetota bacterium]
MNSKLIWSVVTGLLLLAGCVDSDSGHDANIGSDQPEGNAADTRGTPPPGAPDFQLDRIVVRRIFEDSVGNLWLGTNGNGAYRFNGESLDHFSVEQGLGGWAIRGIVEDESGCLWFATSAGVTQFDGTGFTNYTCDDGMIDDDVWSLEIDHRGTIWLGTLQGAMHFDGSTFTSVELPEAEPDPTRGVTSARIVHDIMEDSRRRMWFGTNGGACMRDGDTLTVYSEDDGLCNNAVNGILEDLDGNIWFATHHNGVCRWNGEEFTHFDESDGIHGTEAWKLYLDRSGNIWFPIEQAGVYRFDGESFSNFHSDEGMKCNGVQSVLEDSAGRIWVGGWMALYHFDGEQFHDHQPSNDQHESVLPY